jgi:hypothetical protein
MTEELTAAKALEVFGGGRVVVRDKPLFCATCDEKLLAEYKQKYSTVPMKELVSLIRKRTARIVERKWPFGRKDWMCNTCGRHVGQWR